MKSYRGATVWNMARIRRELCFSAGSFTYAELYQMCGRALSWMWGRRSPCVVCQPAVPLRAMTGTKNQCGAGWQPARRLVTAAGPPRRRQGPIANRPQVTNLVTNLPHKISSANRRPLSFSWDFAGRRPIQTDHERRWSVPPALLLSFVAGLGGVGDADGLDGRAGRKLAQ